MRKDRRGEVSGEGLLWIPRIVVIGFIALAILGISGVYYSYYVDVRDIEAEIMSATLFSCLAPGGIVDVSSMLLFSDSLLAYCGFDAGEVSRFYVRARILSEEGSVVADVHQGDSGLLWVVGLFSEGSSVSDSVKKYKPGYYTASYPVCLEADCSLKGLIELEVVVSNEF